MTKTNRFAARSKGYLVRLSLALTAVFGLMAADGEGCSLRGEEVEGTTDGGVGTSVPACAPGEVPEVVCSEPVVGPGGETIDPVCEQLCVPEEGCPEGTYAVRECEGEGFPEGPPPPEGFNPEDPDAPPPPLDGEGAEIGPHPPEGYGEPADCEHPIEPPPGEEACQLVCVPIDSCDPGEHEETVCTSEGPPPSDEPPVGPTDPLSGGGSDDFGGESEPGEPLDECFTVCVPDDGACGPGEHEETVCYSEGPPPSDEPTSSGGSDPLNEEPPTEGGEGCFSVCVSDEGGEGPGDDPVDPPPEL